MTGFNSDASGHSLDNVQWMILSPSEHLIKSSSSQYGYMDDLRFEVFFNSISVISG